MNSKNVVKILVPLSGLLAVSASPTAKEAKTKADNRPNILYIMTDQQCSDMIQALSGNKYISTPNMDRLAKSGYAFTRTYCANPLSVPSRFALQTGESPAKFGVRTNGPFKGLDEKILPVVKERSMGALFRKAGYDTYYAGKIHLPFATSAAGVNSSMGGVDNYGFDLLTTDTRQTLADTGADFLKTHKGDKPFLLFLSFINPHDICAEVNFLRERDNRLAELQKNKHKNEALDCIDVYHQQEKQIPDSFFQSDESATLPTNMAVTNGHPLNLARATVDKTQPTAEDWRRYIWIYHRLVEYVDAQIGQVLDALDKSPYKDNTVIIFTSDHGEMGGSHSITSKTILFEECQKVPFVFSGKGIAHGVDNSSIVCNGYDLLPTMCDIAGIATPKGLQGQSLYGRITKNTPLPQRGTLFLECTSGFEILSDGRYKYCLYDPTSVPRYEVLIDLQKDPGEVHNIVADKAYKPILEKLRDQMTKELAARDITLNTYRKGAKMQKDADE